MHQESLAELRLGGEERCTISLFISKNKMYFSTKYVSLHLSSVFIVLCEVCLEVHEPFTDMQC